MEKPKGLLIDLDGTLYHGRQRIEGADLLIKMEKTFDEAGTYRIVSHVTARGMHSMPLKELTVTE